MIPKIIHVNECEMMFTQFLKIDLTFHTFTQPKMKLILVCLANARLDHTTQTTISCIQICALL